jgi:peptidoglycan/LPS O-acetylase OafA/YrhL
LVNRNKADEHSTSKKTVLKSFIVRRALRIFPIYYLTLLFVAIFVAGSFTGKFIYFFTYTSNFYFFFNQSWGNDPLAPYWSLSVEEQFYLIWPLLILFISRRYLLHVILLFLMIGVAAQFALMNVAFGDILTISCFDGFGIGALLAWLVVFKPELVKQNNMVWTTVFIMACAFQFVRVVFDYTPFPFPVRSVTAIATIVAIRYFVLHQQANWFNRIVANKAMLLIGKISYGVYLFHMITPIFSTRIFTQLNILLPEQVLAHELSVLRVENFMFLIFFAWCSYRFIEQPMLNLKNKFEYQQGNKTPTSDCKLPQTSTV